jgi:mono/diheme cytochrome c family protein
VVVSSLIGLSFTFAIEAATLQLEPSRMTRDRLKRSVGVAYAIIGLLIVFASSSCGTRGTTGDTQALPPNNKPKIRPLTDVVFERTESRRERGKYLTEGLLQCFICHTDRDWKAPGAPPVKGREGSGHVWRDDAEFRLVAPNITPDIETGAGTWTDDMLARAIREGVSHDDRVLHPQMWYGSFRALSDEDLASIVVYLRTIPAVHNALPRTKLEKERDPAEQITEPVPQLDQSDPVKRGGYLVRIADCVGCHTAWEAPLNPGFFGGGNFVERANEKAVSSNLTPDASGISYYDDALFIQVIRTGQVKARKINSIMPWTVFRRLNDDDLKGIFAYLRARRPVRHTVDNTEAPSECAMCGQKHGFGDRNHSKIEEIAKADPSTYGAFAGEYRFEDGFTVIITREANRLLIQFQGDDSKIELLPISETEFTAPEIPDVISFVRDGRGRVTHLLSNADDVAKKIR